MMVNQPQDMRSWLKNIDNVSNLLPPSINLSGYYKEGGQGVIYRGDVAGQDAAVKIYFPGQIRTRIEREVNDLKAIKCHSVVSLLWNGEITVNNEEVPVVATEFIEGMSLEEVIQHHRFQHEELGVLAYDVAEAISNFKIRHLVHRDLKPSNIVVRPNGRACVIDLGLARHSDLTPVTAPGVSWGTQGYLSPEQADGVGNLTSKSDVFALGILLVQCALGHHPSGGSQVRLMNLKLHMNLPDEINSWQHADLVKGMLNPDPTIRPLVKAVLLKLAAFAPHNH